MQLSPPLPPRMSGRYLEGGGEELLIHDVADAVGDPAMPAQVIAVTVGGTRVEVDKASYEDSNSPLKTALAMEGDNESALAVARKDVPIYAEENLRVLVTAALRGQFPKQEFDDIDLVTKDRLTLLAQLIVWLHAFGNAESYDEAVWTWGLMFEEQKAKGFNNVMCQWLREVTTEQVQKLLKEWPVLFGIQWTESGAMQSLHDEPLVTTRGEEFFELYEEPLEQEESNECWLRDKILDEISTAQSITKKLLENMPIDGILKTLAPSQDEILHKRRFDLKQRVTAQRKELQIMVRKTTEKQARLSARIVKLGEEEEADDAKEREKKNRLILRLCSCAEKAVADKEKHRKLHASIMAKEHLTKVAFLDALTVLSPDETVLNASARYPVGLDILTALTRAIIVHSMLEGATAGVDAMPMDAAVGADEPVMPMDAAAGADGLSRPISHEVIDRMCLPIRSPTDTQFKRLTNELLHQRCMVGTNCGREREDDDAASDSDNEGRASRQRRCPAKYGFFMTSDERMFVMAAKTPLMVVKEPKVGANRCLFQKWEATADVVLALYPQCQLTMACGKCISRKGSSHKMVYGKHVHSMEVDEESVSEVHRAYNSELAYVATAASQKHHGNVEGANKRAKVRK